MPLLDEELLELLLEEELLDDDELLLEEELEDELLEEAELLLEVEDPELELLPPPPEEELDSGAL